MLIHVHVSPTPMGDEDGKYTCVEGAIRVIEESGLEYQVGALGTTVQGPAEKMWPLMQELHNACFTAGAETVMTHIRLLQSKDDVIEASMSELASRITH